MIEDTLRHNALKFYYKYTHGTSPSYFYIYNIERQGAHHSHDTRQRNQLKTYIRRKKYADNAAKSHICLRKWDNFAHSPEDNNP